MAEKAGKARPRVVVFPYLAARLHARILDATAASHLRARSFFDPYTVTRRAADTRRDDGPTIVRFPVIKIGIIRYRAMRKLPDQIYLLLVCI